MNYKMKSFKEYIIEKEESNDKGTTERGDIKFTIWERPDKKVTWLYDNNKYQKIEYVYQNKDKDISIDFLLGFKDGSWKLWVGKVGSVSYDDDPYCSFDTDKFSEGIVAALDKVQEFLEDVKNNPDNWVQYYLHR